MAGWHKKRSRIRPLNPEQQPAVSFRVAHQFASEDALTDELFVHRPGAYLKVVRQDDPIRAELIELIFLKCRVSMQEFDLDLHHVVVVLAALVRAIVTAAAAVELTLWRAISDAQRRTDRRDCVGLGHD